MKNNILVILCFLAFPLLLFAGEAETAEDRTAVIRESMVENHIKARNIQDEAVLEAMRRVPRHKMVPEEQRDNAYQDRPLPIGHGQTISQPYMVAYMTEVTEPEEEHVALEIGTGSGYQAAVLAEIVSEVYTIEIIPELGERAEKDLDELGYENVHVKIADGFHGWEEHAPFDIIIVTAAAEQIPPPLIDQLKDGGKMVIPVGSPYLVQTMMLVEKDGDDIKTRNLMPVRFVPFIRE